MRAPRTYRKARFVSIVAALALTGACGGSLSPMATSSPDGASPIGAPTTTDSTIAAIEEAVLATDLPTTYDEARVLASSLPRQLGGLTTEGPVETGDEPPTTVVSYGQDRAHPLAGVEFLVLGNAPGVTAADMVNATAHLGFGLDEESSSTAGDEEFPRVIGHVVLLEGVGRLAAEDQGYLATWAPSATSEVSYALLGTSEEALMTALEVLSAAAT